MVHLLLFALCIAISAAFNAVMDRIENENFYNSVFRDMNERFWYKRISWQYAKKVFGYKIDAWHLAKSAMIICFAFSLKYAMYLPFVVSFITVGVVWNVSFYLFYHKIFYRK